MLHTPKRNKKTWPRFIIFTVPPNSLYSTMCKVHKMVSEQQLSIESWDRTSACTWQWVAMLSVVWWAKGPNPASNRTRTCRVEACQAGQEWLPSHVLSRRVVGGIAGSSPPRGVRVRLRGNCQVRGAKLGPSSGTDFPLLHLAAISVHSEAHALGAGKRGAKPEASTMRFHSLGAHRDGRPCFPTAATSPPKKHLCPS